MSQSTDYTLGSSLSGTNFRTEINSILAAALSLNSGTSAPSYATEGTLWLDTTNATTPVLKMKDADSDWIELGTFNYTTNTLSISSVMTYDWSTNYVTTGGSANAYTAALNPARASYTAGEVITLVANFANTGAATLAVNGLAAKNIYKYTSTPLAAGDIQANQLILLAYNGTAFILLNPPSPTTTTPTHYFQGCVPSYISASTIGISAGVMRNSANDGDIELAGTETCDLSTSGAGGLDTGSEAAGTFYYYYAITDGATPALIASTTNEYVSGSITLPSGYTKKRQIMGPNGIPFAVKNDSSSNIIPFLIKNDLVAYSQFDHSTTYQLASALTPAINTYTAVDFSSLVPPSSRFVYLVAQAAIVGAGARQHVYVRPTGSSAEFLLATGSWGNSISEETSFLPMELGTTQQIDCKRVDVDTRINLWAAGYFF